MDRNGSSASFTSSGLVGRVLVGIVFFAILIGGVVWIGSTGPGPGVDPGVGVESGAEGGVDGGREEPLTPRAGERPPVAGRFEPAWADLGTRSPNEVVTARVELVNEAGVPVEIANVVSSCACLVAEAEGATIPPGGSVGVTLRLEVGSRQAQRAAHRVTAVFDGPWAPASIFVRARTEPVFEIAWAGEGSTEAAVVRALDGSAFRVIATPWFVAEVQPGLEEATTEAVLRLDASTPPAEIPREAERLGLAHPEHGTIVIDWRSEVDKSAAGAREGDGGGETAGVRPRRVNLPATPLPPARPEPEVLSVEVPPSGAAGGRARATVDLIGLTSEDAARLTTRAIGNGRWEVEIVDTEATADALRTTLEFRFRGEPGGVGSVTFRYDDRPLATVRAVFTPGEGS